MDYYDVYIFSDQPTTCPICGIRTEIIVDLFDSHLKTQLHNCPNFTCNYSFLVEEDFQ